MKLQGRNLFFQTPPMQGVEVAVLQQELRQLGYTIADAESEGATFGPATHQAILDFQNAQLPATGVVAEATAVALFAYRRRCK